MKPIVLNKKVLLPFPTLIGKLCEGELFKIKEKSALQKVVRKENAEWVISKRVFGKGTSRTNSTYPVIQYI